MGADLLSWLFRSPRRLISVAGLAVVAVVVVALFLGQGGGDSTATATPSPTVTAAVPDSSAPVSAAVAFVQVWGHTDAGETAAQWRAKVKPLATTELADALELTDPASLPQATAQGEPVVRFVSRGSALIAVPLSSGDRVVVTLISQGTEWLASDVQPDVGDGPT